MARTTTDAKNWRFHYTITDLGRFLGKSPVTLRGWERQGLISVPRDPSGDRKLGNREVAGVAKRAYDARRISRTRRDLVCATVTLMEVIERENVK
jgi:predicted site-specific integrase-resolvase